MPPNSIPTLYDLIANVTHESVAGTTRDKENTIWKAHIRAAGGGGDNEKWFMIQDLIVEETRKEMIFLGETILQVLSFSFILPKKINIVPTDLGTSDRSTMTMMMTKIEKFPLPSCHVPLLNIAVNQRIDNIIGRNIFSGRYRDLASLCSLSIGYGLSFCVVGNILAMNSPPIKL